MPFNYDLSMLCFSRLIRFFLLLVLCCCIPVSFAFNPSHLRFDKLSVEDGLSQLSVTSILQDRHGFMWFGTQYGLNRFDGYEFQVFKHDSERDDTTLSANFIRCITEDPDDGKLWIGTGSGGISVFDPKTELFRHFSHQAEDPFSLSNDAIRTILIDKNKDVWVGSSNGIDKFDRETERFHSIELVDGATAHVRDIVEDNQGTLWVATSQGLFYKTPESDNFILSPLGSIDSRSEIASLSVDRSGGLWIGMFNLGLIYRNTVGGDLQYFQHQRDDIKSLSNNSVRDIVQMKDGSIWVGTDSGLNILQHPGDREFLHFRSDESNTESLSSSLVSSLFQDKAGIVWLGTWTGGLNKVDLQAIQFSTFEPDSERGSSGVTQGPDSTMWVGSSQGLHRLTETKKISKAISHPHEVENLALRNQITGLDYSTKESVIWLGTRLGLSRYREQDQWLESVALKDTSIYSVKEDLDGSIWVGSYDNGLIHLERDSFRIIEQYDMPPVIHMWQENPGELWVASGEGLFWLDARNGELISYTRQAANSNSISHNGVTWVHKDGAERYWVGTHGGFDQMTLENGNPRKARFIGYTSKEGLSSDAVGAIIDDSRGDLWISTTSGISRFNPKTKEITNFGYTEGALKGGYYAGFGFRSAAKRVFFSGPSGLTAFAPEDIRQSDFEPPVYFNKLRIFNRDTALSNDRQTTPLKQPLFMQQSVELDYSQSVISFDFTALDYSSPQKNRYAYRLQGFEKDWNYVDAKRRSATYTNLDPGQYDLQLRGTNKDGIWNPRETVLQLVISPPWWMTWWAKTAAFLLVSLLLTGIYRLRIRRLKARSTILRQLVQERTQSLEMVNQKLEKISRLDDLTNISNRRDFIEQANREWERAKRHKANLCLVLVDIDNFKDVNDTYGHDCGDLVLVKIAKLLTDALRSGDILARWGGEEFSVLLPDTELSGGRAVAEKMRSHIGDAKIDYDGQLIKITITLGLVQMKDEEAFNACLKRADIALYEGKEKGRDQVVAVDEAS